MLRLQVVRGIFDKAEVLKELGEFQNLDAIYQYIDILFNSPAYFRELGDLNTGELFLDYGSHVLFLRVTKNKIVEQENFLQLR